MALWGLKRDSTEGRKFRIHRGWAAFGILLGSALLYNAWRTRDLKYEWREEVKLSDGTIIHVERVRILEVRPGGEPFQGPARGDKEQRIVIPIDQEKSIEWKSKHLPLIIDRGVSHSGWTIIVTAGLCEDHWQLGSPKPPYAQFDFIENDWNRVPFRSEYLNKESNMLLGNPKKFQSNRYDITLKEKKKWNHIVNGIPNELLKIDPSYQSTCDLRRGWK